MKDLTIGWDPLELEQKDDDTVVVEEEEESPFGTCLCGSRGGCPPGRSGWMLDKD
jgi:hypothetical protein